MLCPLQIILIVVSTFTVKSCSSQLAPGYRCNDTYIMTKLHQCETTLLRSLINNSLSNCNIEVERLQLCTGRFIVNTCYKSIYAIYPKFGRAIFMAMNVIMQQFNNALFYCPAKAVSFNWSTIPETVRQLLPCDTKFFELSKKCSKKFHSVFKKNQTDPALCRLYQETKVCRHRLSYMYCTTPLPDNHRNPFCEQGVDQKNASHIGTRVRCMVHVCAKSSSKLVATAPCPDPREVTCNTPPGSPFKYNICMTTRLTIEPIPGVTVVQENRDCSSLPVCRSHFYCNNANSTGVVKTCQTMCCHGNMCNKKNDNTEIVKQHTKSSALSGSILTCMSQTCTTSSVNVTSTCKPALPIACKGYDQCITVRKSIQPYQGVTLVQTIGNCSTFLKCKEDLYCKEANSSGLLIKCDVKCCAGNLCNKAWLPRSKEWRILEGKKIPIHSSRCSTIVKDKMTQCNARFLSTIINKPLTCRKVFDSLVVCYNDIHCASMSGIPSQLVPLLLIKQLYCHPLEGNSVPQSTIRTILKIKPSILQHTIPCNLTFYSQNLRCLRPFIKIKAVNTNDSRLCRFYQKARNCIYQNAKEYCRSVPHSYDFHSNPFCVDKRQCKGAWTKVSPSWITGHKWYGVRVGYKTEKDNSLLINVQVTSYGCRKRPGSGLTTFIKGNWTKIMYTQEFRGRASCWRIFGNSGRSGGYKNYDRSGLEEFSRRHGDKIYDELRMGGNNDTFKGTTTMCGKLTSNFWHAQYGHGLRRATVILRKNPISKHAGIHTATSCGVPSYTIRDIFVYHC